MDTTCNNKLRESYKKKLEESKKLKKQNKMMVTGALFAVGILVFMPKIYIQIAEKLGKRTELVTEGI